MEQYKNQAAVLLLADGTIFNGFSCGKIGTTTGEICFSTSMTGYQELFTDPSYHGQLLVTTHVHIGNYGVSEREQESERIQIEGLICKTFNQRFSRAKASGSIQDYFIEDEMVGIQGIDTRAIVKHIRDKGAMNAIVSSEIDDIEELKAQLAKVPSMEGLELSSTVSTKEAYELGDSSAKYRIAVLDLGVKKSILSNFESRDCFLKVFPAKSSFEEMQAWGADGYFISNGPGDPSAMDYAVTVVKDILAVDKPLFGICLGHQILARALDIPTYKMHHGHRGCNHPVKNIITNRSEISTQNHGFAVDADALRDHPNAEITHVNLNDDTIEGMKVKGKKAFSVQYHPEASPGPHDSRYLFDNFIELMKNSNHE